MLRHAPPVCQLASLPDENRYNGGKQTPGATHGASQFPRPSLPGHILRPAASPELTNEIFGRLPDCSLVSLRNQRLGWSKSCRKFAGLAPHRLCIGSVTAVAGANPSCMLTQLRSMDAARSGSPAGAAHHTSI